MLNHCPRGVRGDEIKCTSGGIHFYFTRSTNGESMITAEKTEFTDTNAGG